MSCGLSKRDKDYCNLALVKISSKMRRYLKLMLSISLLTISYEVSASGADTLKGKGYVAIGVNYGIPIYNRISIEGKPSQSDDYKVKSKFKSCLSVNITLNRRKNNLLLGFLLIQSQFMGKEFNLGAGAIPYKGVSYPYYYNICQRVKYNVYYFNLGYGYDIKFKYKHVVKPSIQLAIPLLYKIGIDNFYTENQTSDTTLFRPSKNTINDDTNFGHIPRLNFGLSYRYNPTARIGIILNLSLLYSMTIDKKNPEFNNHSSAFDNSGKYSYLAYHVKNQTVILPSIGLNIKLN